MNNLMKLKEKKLMNLKKNDKGFTLIEMVIVLVIIAILAAILVPSMMGWIKDAKSKAFQTETRNIYTGYVSAASNLYVSNGTYPAADANGAVSADVAAAMKEKLGQNVNIAGIKIETDASGLTKFTYTSGGNTAVYTAVDGKWTYT